MPNTDAPDEEPPAFWAERGFFPVDTLADRDSTHAPLTTDPHYKNIEFLRLKDFALHLLGPRRDMLILDLGCADGAQMVYCGLQGATVYGQDLSQEQVDRVNQKLAYLHLVGEARVGDATELSFDTATFDAVISSDFHEHLDAPAQVAALRECLRVLKPGGTLVLKTPNLGYLRASLWYKRLRALLHGRTPFGYTIPHAKGSFDPQHVGLTTRWHLARHLHEAGFLNWEFHYAALRRFGLRPLMDVASTEVPILRDWLCEDLVCRAWKPIALSHFPD